MRRHLTALLRDTAGITAVEFALVLPIMVFLAAGTVEFGRLLLISQKLQNGTFILADLTARDKTLSEDQLDNIFLALDNIIQPYEFADTGTAFVSSIGVDSFGDPVVNWQRSGAGTLAADSAVGEEGAEATLPDDLSIADGETIIVAEVFYSFEPLFGLTTSNSVLHKVAYVKPRLGTLETILP
jgi:Flp pilus assembly protein TadG